MNKVRGRDVSARIADECFTNEQKEILEFTQGKVNLTLQKQLDLRFGSRVLWYDEESHIAKFAELVYFYAHRIKQIKEAQEQYLERLITPATYRKVNQATRKDVGEDQTANEQTQTLKTASLSYGIGKTQALAETDAKSQRRDASTIESKNYEDIEKWDIKNKLEVNTVTSITDKNVDITKLSLEEGITAAITDTELTRAEIPESEQADNRDVCYNALNYGLQHDSSLTVNKGNSETTDHSQSKSDNVASGKTTTKKDSSGETTTQDYVEGDDILRSMNETIPNLRRKFWNLFDHLYMLCT